MVSGREKILVVASDPTVLDIISRQALAAAGYEISTATDFTAAMEAVSSFRPDAMILDVKLAGMNARDLMMALSTQGIELPVIALAPKGEEVRVIQAFRVGAVDYVLWPAHEPEIISVVERALKQLRNRREREQLSDELQHRVQELTTISNLGKIVMSTTNLQDLFNRILQAALNSTQSDTGWLSILDESSGNYNLVSCHNLPEGISKKMGQSWKDEISQQAIKSGKVFQSSAEDLLSHPIATLGQSVVAQPIKARQQIIGMLTLMRKEPKSYSESDLRILEALGDYAAISLANAYLFHANVERERSLRFSMENFQVNQKISNSLVVTAKQEIQSSIKKITEMYSKIMMSDTSQLQLKQQQRMVQLNEEVINLANLSDAMYLPLLEMPDLSRTRVLLNELVQSEIKSLEAAFKKLHVTPHLDDDVNYYLNCQPSLIGAIIRGVICLGLKHSLPAEEMQIQLESLPNGNIQVKVEAMGESVSQQQVDRLFMSNTSGNLSSERKFLGIGLEPSIIRELIQNVGGEFSIEPLEKGGIRVRVIFLEG